MKNWFKIGILVVLVLILAAAVITLSSCSTFKPVWIKELPAECNVTLNAVKLYYDSKDKSGAAPALEYCFKCLHRLRCQAEVFGMNDKGPLQVDYTDTVKFRNFSQCMSELK